MSRSIADLKARSVIEIDPFLIDPGGMPDRLDSDVNEDADLTRSIAAYGQQVPVLVRPHPDTEGRFQIVYGRRRVLALRDLGQPVKALVRDLDDRQLVLAQGQENTARRDLSFIEKVNFARQMDEAGYDRKVICDALTRGQDPDQPHDGDCRTDAAGPDRGHRGGPVGGPRSLDGAVRPDRGGRPGGWGDGRDDQPQHPVRQVG